MGVITGLINDVKHIINYRRRLMPIQKERNLHAPKEGDTAPDFTLSDNSGTEAVTLSGFRGEKPVALVFGSFT